MVGEKARVGESLPSAFKLGKSTLKANKNKIQLSNVGLFGEKIRELYEVYVSTARTGNHLPLQIYYIQLSTCLFKTIRQFTEAETSFKISVFD